MSDPIREGEAKLSLRDTRMKMSKDVQALLPEENLGYYESTNQMHCGPGEGGSKFTDERVGNIFDVVAMRQDLGKDVANRVDDREALLAAGAPASAFLPATKDTDAPAGLPEALYFKVDNVEGRLGIARVGDLDPSTRVFVRREKGKSDPSDRKTYVPVSFTVIRGTVDDMPKTDFATIIVGRSPGEDNGVWTVHPGAPIRPAGGEYSFTQGLVGPDEVPAGEKQPARVMTLAEVMSGANLTENDYVKIVPGNLDEVSSKYEVI